MAIFPLPAVRKKSVFGSDRFMGVDSQSSPSNVITARSPYAQNMIRGEAGKVRKRMGYYRICPPDSDVPLLFSAAINGVYIFNSHRIVHSGTLLYDTDADGEARLVYSLMNNAPSAFFEFNGALYILDGKTYLRYLYDDVTPTVIPVSECAYAPLFVISRVPSGNDMTVHTDASGRTVGGGGTVLEPINLLSSYWRESYLGNGTDTVYKLTEKLIDSVTLVQVRDSFGNYQTVSSGYTVNTNAGTVTFDNPVGESPVLGMDNVIITVRKTRAGYADKINKCVVGMLFGVNGDPDRLFTGGNGTVDYYSQLDDLTYFPDTNYCTHDGSISGYGYIGNSLASFLDSGGVIIRSGELDSNGEAVFKTTDRLECDALISKRTIAYAGGETLFLTRSGVYALTVSDVTKGKCTSLRSYYINGFFSTACLDNACCIVYNGYYIISHGEKLYILDTLQKSYTSQIPLSDFQYECYYCTNIPADVLWSENEALCFGNSSGKLYAFYTDSSLPLSYNDDGAAINAYWETPDIDEKLFYKNKSYSYLALRIAPGILTGVKVYLQKKGIWRTKPILDSGVHARYISFELLDFEKFTFSADATPKTVKRKIRVKKADKIRLRFENAELNEPFGLFEYAIEYL